MSTTRARFAPRFGNTWVTAQFGPATTPSRRWHAHLVTQCTGSAIRAALDNAIRTAVWRGILQNKGGGLSLRYRTLEQYAEDDRDGLEIQLLAALDGRIWVGREDATTASARWTGFRRTGSKIEEVADSLINGLLREERLDKDGTRI